MQGPLVGTEGTDLATDFQYRQGLVELTDQ